MASDLIWRIFYVVLGLVYIGLGIYMYIKKIIPNPALGLILSVLFVGYGAWRMYRGATRKR